MKRILKNDTKAYFTQQINSVRICTFVNSTIAMATMIILILSKACLPRSETVLTWVLEEAQRYEFT